MQCRGRACLQELRALLVLQPAELPQSHPSASAICKAHRHSSAVWHRSVTRARAAPAGLNEVERRLFELVELSERDMPADDSLLLEGRGLLERLSQQIQHGGGAGGGARGGQRACEDSDAALLEQGRCLLRRARGRMEEL
jgi:hypothetical protein